MKRFLIAALAGAVIVLPARAQLIGQPSAQGGAPPPQPNVSTTPPSVPNTSSGTSQFQNPNLLDIPGSSSSPFGANSSEFGGAASPRTRRLNEARSPQLRDRGQAERPEGPLR
jgi:hypothetical protein